MYNKDFAIGDKVVVIKTREELLDEVTAPEKFLPVGWEGTIIKKGISISGDKIFNAYDLQGIDGKIVEGYPSPGFIGVYPGSKRNVVKIIRDIIPFINDSIEQAELHTAIKYVMRAYGEAEVEFLLHTIYQYGKTAGVRQERQRKKTLSEEKI